MAKRSLEDIAFAAAVAANAMNQNKKKTPKLHLNLIEEILMITSLIIIL